MEVKVTRLIVVTRARVCAVIQLARDGVGDIGQLLPLFRKIIRGCRRPVLVEPLGRVSHGIPEL